MVILKKRHILAMLIMCAVCFYALLSSYIGNLAKQSTVLVANSLVSGGNVINSRWTLLHSHCFFDLKKPNSTLIGRLEYTDVTTAILGLENGKNDCIDEVVGHVGVGVISGGHVVNGALYLAGYKVAGYETTPDGFGIIFLDDVPKHKAILLQKYFAQRAEGDVLYNHETSNLFGFKARLPKN